jgi:hypothetical protein
MPLLMRNLTFDPNNPPSWSEHDNDQDTTDIKTGLIVVLGMFIFVFICLMVIYKLFTIRDPLPSNRWSLYQAEADSDYEDEDGESDPFVTESWLHRRVRSLLWSWRWRTVC